MGSVIKQLSDELNQRQSELRYGMAKGALAGVGVLFVAVMVLLWKRPIALAYVASAVLSLLLWDSVWFVPLVLSLLLVGVVVYDVVTADGQRIFAVRRSLKVRRTRITLKRGWKHSMSDLGLTSSYDRRGSKVVVYPKLEQIEERK